MENGNVNQKHACMNQQADLLDILKCRLRCTYISDLRIEPYNSYARTMLEEMDLSGYPYRDIIDVLKYVYTAA